MTSTASGIRMTAMTDEPKVRQRMLQRVMLAVFVWGSLLALGALLFGRDPTHGDVRFSPSIWRGLIVEACVVGFLGMWWLAARRRR